MFCSGYSLGIDIGTSGVRAVIMDNKQCIIAQANQSLPPSQPFYSPAEANESNEKEQPKIIGYSQTPLDWWTTLESVLFHLSERLKEKNNLSFDIITHLAIDGTSGTVLLCDANGKPLTEALMYNDQRAVHEAVQIQRHAAENTAAIGATSGLAKVLWLYKHNNEMLPQVHYALNQSDWLSGMFMGQFGLSDHNNALKMGYDAQTHCWPEWLVSFLQKSKFPISLLPEVLVPGQVMAKVSVSIAQHFGFNQQLNICAGTTDSTAAVIAAGAEKAGDAITSLGSTLVMKVVTEEAIYDNKTGVYSQPFGDLWLVGGGSNSGGEIFKKYFSQQKLNQLTELLDNKVNNKTLTMLNLNYYPLSVPGERFPIQNPYLEPKMLPRPESDSDFFQALLEGMADIETMAYKKLVELGAPYPKLVKSIGGGAFNQSWSYIREQKLGIPVKKAELEQAACGTAKLAQSSWH